MTQLIDYLSTHVHEHDSGITTHVHEMFGDVHGLATVDKLKHVFVGEWAATHTLKGKSI